MIRKIVFSLLLVLCAFILCAADKPVITVLDFTTEGLSKNDMNSILSFLSSVLLKTGKLTVIDDHATRVYSLLCQRALFLPPCSACIFRPAKRRSSSALPGGNRLSSSRDGQWSYNNVAVDGTSVYLSYVSKGSLNFPRSKDSGHTWEKAKRIGGGVNRISMASRQPVLAIACVSGDSLFSFWTTDGGTSFVKTKIGDAGGSGDCYTGIDCRQEFSFWTLYLYKSYICYEKFFL